MRSGQTQPSTSNCDGGLNSKPFGDTLPKHIAFYMDALEKLNDPLYEEEKEGIERMVPKRLHEYAAGRSAARRAIQMLGRPPCAIPRGNNRAPIWPHGLKGSISHSSKLAAAVVSESLYYQSLGIDVEYSDRLTPELWKSVLTKREIANLEKLAPTIAIQTATLIFSAKEAFFKSQPAEIQSGHAADPQNIEIFIDETSRTFSCKTEVSGSHIPKGIFVHNQGHWITLAYIPFKLIT